MSVHRLPNSERLRRSALTAALPAAPHPRAPSRRTIAAPISRGEKFGPDRIFSPTNWVRTQFSVSNVNSVHTDRRQRRQTSSRERSPASHEEQNSVRPNFQPTNGSGPSFRVFNVNLVHSRSGGEAEIRSGPNFQPIFFRRILGPGALGETKQWARGSPPDNERGTVRPDCPDPALLNAAANGRLDAAKTARWQEHLNNCPACAAALAEIQLLHSGLQYSDAPNARGARRPRRASKRVWRVHGSAPGCRSASPLVAAGQRCSNRRSATPRSRVWRSALDGVRRRARVPKHSRPNRTRSDARRRRRLRHRRRLSAGGCGRQ